jgi:hypothetical protein
MIHASSFSSKTGRHDATGPKRLSDLPISGFLRTHNEFLGEDDTINFYDQLAWTADPSIKHFGFTILAEQESARAMLEGRNIGSKNCGAGSAAFRQSVAKSLQAARTMPNGSRGLILKGDFRAWRAFKQAPAELIKVFVADVGGEKLELPNTRKILIASTTGMRCKFFLSLEKSGWMTAACWRQRPRRNHGFNRNAFINRVIELPIVVEWRAKTGLRLEDFKGMTPEQARRNLVKRFWTEIAPSIPNRFVHPKTHGLPEHGSMGLSDIRVKRSTPEALEHALRCLACVALDQGAVASRDAPAPYLQFERLGFECATPSSPARARFGRLSRVSRGVERILKVIVSECAPEGFGVSNEFFHSGNRLNGITFKSFGVYAGYVAAQDESGHFKLEAEAELIRFLVEIGVTQHDAEMLIRQIAPDDGPYRF